MQPTYNELLQHFHRWVARLYGVKISCTVQDDRGNWSESEIDGTKIDLPAK